MSQFRVGVMDPTIAARPTADVFTRANYLNAVANRVDSFWVPDHLNAIVPAFVVEAKVLRRNEARAKRLTHSWSRGPCSGTSPPATESVACASAWAVTDTGRRNPAVTAQAAATLHLLTRGRAILGIGPGEREGNEPYGVDWSKPVARFEEAMATIRALWDSGGELVNRDSPYFPLRNALFDLPPYRGKWPEIWIAAHGPRMLRAAGRYGDGYFPGFPHRPQDYAQRLEVVRAAASDAGRDPMSIIPAVWLFGRHRSQP